MVRFLGRKLKMGKESAHQGIFLCAVTHFFGKRGEVAAKGRDRAGWGLVKHSGSEYRGGGGLGWMGGVSHWWEGEERYGSEVNEVYT
jgi:hypothetical protein